MSIKTPLAKAKGLGSAKEGAASWRLMHLTSFALIPLVIWFVISVLQLLKADSPQTLYSLLASPTNTVGLMLLFTIGLYHASAGMKVIYEDYIGCHGTRAVAITLTHFLSIVTGASGVVAIITAHVKMIAGG